MTNLDIMINLQKVRQAEGKLSWCLLFSTSLRAVSTQGSIAYLPLFGDCNYTRLDEDSPFPSIDSLKDTTKQCVAESCSHILRDDPGATSGSYSCTDESITICCISKYYFPILQCRGE